MNPAALPLPSQSARPLTSRWFTNPIRCQSPRWRLVCFPFAGAGASVYYSWAKPLAPLGIELWNVQYPGRETRLADAPVREFGAMIEQLTEALRAVEAGDVPLTFFGHSLGAVLAHEVACELSRQGRRLPAALFLSGRNAPPHRSEPPRLDELPPGELLDALVESGNLSEAVRNEPDWMELLLPALRADFALLHGYHLRWKSRQVEPLDCPLSVFGGDQDPWTHSEGLMHWRHFARGPFRLRTYPGAHFFIKEHREAIWQAIADDLQQFAF